MIILKNKKNVQKKEQFDENYYIERIQELTFDKKALEQSKETMFNQLLDVIEEKNRLEVKISTMESHINEKLHVWFTENKMQPLNGLPKVQKQISYDVRRNVDVVRYTIPQFDVAMVVDRY